MIVDSYIETVSGKSFYFLDPQPEQFDIKDIAHSLSMNCRFVGHCSRFYSVAEHSWNCTRMLEGFSKEIQLAGLLHDASEAYITDVASPVKQHLPDYKEMEDRISAALFAKYNLEYPMHPAIKQVDMAMLSNEAHWLLTSQGNTWDMWKYVKRPPIQPEYRPVGMDPKQAKGLFLDKFYELTE